MVPNNNVRNIAAAVILAAILVFAATKLSHRLGSNSNQAAAKANAAPPEDAVSKALDKHIAQLDQDLDQTSRDVAKASDSAAQSDERIRAARQAPPSAAGGGAERGVDPQDPVDARVARESKHVAKELSSAASHTFSGF